MAVEPPQSDGGESNRRAPDALPQLPDGFAYGLELGECLGLAAWIGEKVRDETPISYTSVLIAFLVHDRPVSRWFQNFAKAREIDVQAIYGARLYDVKNFSELEALAKSGELPAARQLQSRSFLQICEHAMDVARQVSPDRHKLGGRHVMAAYACFESPAHEHQIQQWGISRDVWKRDFLAFAARQYPDEGWAAFSEQVAFSRSPEALDIGSKVVSGTLTTPTTLIGDFTDDNPYATSIADLLKVDDEAAAFARLVASEEITPPLAIGVFGEWGSGKTFFMRRMRENIAELSRETKEFDGPPDEKWPYLEDIVQIQFDAWHYAEQNLWASLVDYIFAALDAWMLDKSRDDPSGVDHVLDRLATTQQLKLEALETLILRRSERQAAEARAERARARYQEAVKRRDSIRPSSYLLAALKSLMSDEVANEDVKKIKSLRDEALDSLGIPDLENSSERLESAIKEARTEAGRGRLVLHSLFAKLGKFWGIAAMVLVLILIPAIAVWFKDFLARETTAVWLNEIKGSVVAISTILLGITTSLSGFVRRARQGLSKLDEFDQRLQKQIDAKRDALKQTDEANQDRDAQEELQKSRQAFEAAERALEVADANLLAARQDFESGTARGRLNAFIRAKVTSGEYAKHLGIVASIRRDFSQLASLMRSSNDAEQEKAERERLARDANARVDRFFEWLKKTKDVKLTIREVTELMTFLEPAAALKKLEDHKDLLEVLLQGQAEELENLRKTLADASTVQRELPRFSRIVLYIDDLDRCSAEKVVDVLQAVHLLLSFPLFVVVVAVDARWVSRALHDRYPGLLGDNELKAPSHPNGGAVLQGGASPYDYLEKIFQIPYWVRSMDGDAAAGFVEGIASRKKRTSNGSAEKSGTGGTSAANPPRGQAGNGMGSAGSSGGGNRFGESPAPGAAPVRGHAGSPQNVQSSAPSPRKLAMQERQAHAGVRLDDVEVRMLQMFARFVGDTPRRAIRFVNIYRLVKTSLPDGIRDSLIGKDGVSPLYRALIAQLAVANGMPEDAAFFHYCVARGTKTDTMTELKTWLQRDPKQFGPVDMQPLVLLLTILEDSGNGIPSALPVEVKDLQQMLGFARRYSFERS